MTKLIIGNLKNNLQVKDLDKYLNDIKDIDNKNVVICPPSIYIPYFVNHGYSVGIGNISFSPITGEITSSLASSLSINYALIGHSERRVYLKEDNDMINKKVIDALNNHITPILCIGETIEEKELMRTETVLKQQIVNGLRNVDNISDVVIAYDPIWTGESNKKLSSKDIGDLIYFIKSIVNLNFKCDNIRVIYGGGITPDNIEEINSIPYIDGFLIGRSALNVVSFKRIIEVAVK